VGIERTVEQSLRDWYSFKRDGRGSMVVVMRGIERGHDSQLLGQQDQYRQWQLRCGERCRTLKRALGR